MSMGVSFQKITHKTSFRKPVLTLYHKIPRWVGFIPTRTVFDSFGSDLFLSIELRCQFASACGTRRIIVSIHDAILFTLVCRTRNSSGVPASVFRHDGCIAWRYRTRRRGTHQYPLTPFLISYLIPNSKQSKDT